MPSTKKKVKKGTEIKNKNKNKINIVVNVNSKNKNKTTRSAVPKGGFGGGSNSVVSTSIPYPVFQPTQNQQSFASSATHHPHNSMHAGVHFAAPSPIHTASHLAATGVHETPSNVIPLHVADAPTLVQGHHHAHTVHPPQSHRSGVVIEEVGSRIHTPQHFREPNIGGGHFNLNETIPDRLEIEGRRRHHIPRLGDVHRHRLPVSDFYNPTEETQNDFHEAVRTLSPAVRKTILQGYKYHMNLNLPKHPSHAILNDLTIPIKLDHSENTSQFLHEPCTKRIW